MKKTEQSKLDSRPVCFSCPFDIYEWLQNKGEAERRNLSNSVVHALQTAKEVENAKT